MKNTLAAYPVEGWDEGQIHLQNIIEEMVQPVADLGFFKGRGHSGATIYRGGPSIMQFFLDYFVTWH